VTLAADLEVKLSYNPATGNGWNLIGPSNRSAYLWTNVEVVAYDTEGNIVFGPQAIGRLAEDNPWLDTAFWAYADGLYISGGAALLPYAGYGVTARQAGVSLRFPQNAQTDIETAIEENENAASEFRSDGTGGITGGGGGGCFVGSITPWLMWANKK